MGVAPPTLTFARRSAVTEDASRVKIEACAMMVTKRVEMAVTASAELSLA